MRQSAVTFKTEGLNFEGVVATPNGDGAPFPGVIICHPHPLFGGNMDNNVVLAVSFALVERGFATFRFNFRGVGNSEGEHTKGEKEHEEVLGAQDFLKAWKEVDSSAIGLAGYSFGTVVILKNAAVQKQPRAFAFISPPLHGLENSTLKKDKRPKLIVSGDRDKLVQSDKLRSVLEPFAAKPELEIVEGADHFWGGREDRLITEISRFFAENLK